jgi:hypothetical protein
MNERAWSHQIGQAKNWDAVMGAPLARLIQVYN